MASNSIGFAVLLIAVLLGSVALLQAFAVSVDEISDSQSEQLEKSIEVKNQDINLVTDSPNPNEFIIRVENTGMNEIDATKLTILFENTDASITNSFTFDGSTFTPDAEIDGEPVPENRTVIPPKRELDVTYTISGGSVEPSQVRVFTPVGVGDAS